MSPRYPRVTCVVALLGAGTAATSVCSADMVFFNPSNSHTYVLIDGIHNWQDGRVLAAGIGGYLVAINDAAENAWVRDTVFIPHAEPRGTQMWIGATDEVTEGIWLWDSGEVFSYSAWAPGEPNNNTFTGPPDGSGEDYASMWSGPTGSWNDYPSPSIYLPNIPGPSPIWGSVLIEVVPTPSSVLIVTALGCFGLARRSRTAHHGASRAQRL